MLQMDNIQSKTFTI